MMRRSFLKRNPATGAAAAATSSDAPERYHVASRWLHWISGGGMLSCVGLVLAAQKLYPAWDKCTPEQAATKSNLMFWHKSIGLTMLGVAVPRLAFRVIYPAPRPIVAGTEHVLATASHVFLSGLVIVLPVSGAVMGYFSGYGLPFYFTTIAPASGTFGKASNPELAGTAYNIHSYAGKALEFMVPVHASAALAHQFVHRINIFTRVNPFAAA